MQDSRPYNDEEAQVTPLSSQEPGRLPRGQDRQLKRNRRRQAYFARLIQDMEHITSSPLWCAVRSAEPPRARQLLKVRAIYVDMLDRL